MDDDDLIDTDELLDANDRKKPDVKSKTSLDRVDGLFSTLTSTLLLVDGDKK